MATGTMTVVAEKSRQILEPTVKNDFSRHPPIENFVTIDGLLKSHATKTYQKPLIYYPKEGVSDFEEHTAAAIDKYTDVAVDFYIRNGLEPAVSCNNDQVTSYFLPLSRIPIGNKHLLSPLSHHRVSRLF